MRRAALTLLLCNGCLDASPAESKPDAEPGAETPDAADCDEECCPASSLVETFDGDIEDRWETVTTTSECSVAPADGELVIRDASDDGHYCFVKTRAAYRLLDEQAFAEISQPGTGDPDLIFFLELSSGDAVEFSRRPDGLHLGETPAGGNTSVLTQVDFDYGEHRYLMFAGDTDGDGVTLSASGDGVAWTPLFEYMLPTAGTSNCVKLGFGTFGGSTSDVPGAFDNVNLPP